MNRIKINDHLWVPQDFEAEHNYYPDETSKKAYTGATTILSVISKPALIQWAANEVVKYIKDARIRLGDADVFSNLDGFLEEARTAHRKKKEKAAEHGTDAHALVEEFINICLGRPAGKPQLTTYDLASDGERFNPIQAFMTWAYENVDHFLFAEKRMADPALYFAGTADFGYVGKDGKTYMADFKTSSGIYYEMFLQTAAYRYLAELEGMKFDGRVIVRLGKDGKFEVKYRDDYKTDWEAFSAALVLYRAQSTYK